jgi:hypothetical protein
MLIRSTSHNGLSYSDAKPANASSVSSGWAPERSATSKGAPGAI